MKFSRALSDPPFQCTLITETQVTVFNTHDRITNVCGQLDVEAMLTACPAAHGLFSRSAAHGCTQPLCSRPFLPLCCARLYPAAVSTSRLLPKEWQHKLRGFEPPKKHVAWPMHGMAWHVNSIVTLHHVAADAAVAQAHAQTQTWAQRPQACMGTRTANVDVASIRRSHGPSCKKFRNCTRAPRHAGNCQCSCGVRGVHKHAGPPPGQTRTWAHSARNCTCGRTCKCRHGRANMRHAGHPL